jgi:hypothetical protein
MVLLFPPMGFMTLGVWMAFRYGRKRDLEQAPHLTSLRVYDSADADRRSNEALFESNFGA